VAAADDIDRVHARGETAGGLLAFAGGETDSVAHFAAGITRGEQSDDLQERLLVHGGLRDHAGCDAVRQARDIVRQGDDVGRRGGVAENPLHFRMVLMPDDHQRQSLLIKFLRDALGAFHEGTGGIDQAKATLFQRAEGLRARTMRAHDHRVAAQFLYVVHRADADAV